MPHKTLEARRDYYERTREQRNRNRREAAASDPHRVEKQAKAAKYLKVYREENKARLAELNKKYRTENREDLLQKKRDYHHSNKAAANKKSLAWYAVNTEYAKRKNNERYAQDKDRRLANLKTRRASDPLILVRERAYRKGRWEQYKKLKRDYYWRDKSPDSKTYRLASIITRKCARCETPFPTDNGQKIYCSIECCTKESARLWAIRNTHRIRWSQKNRAALLENAGHYTKADWDAVLDYYGNRCAYCGRSDAPLHVDHIIPIIRLGENTAYNICPACEKCNVAKHSHTLIEFLFFRAIGFKLPDRGKRKKSTAGCDEGTLFRKSPHRDPVMARI